MGIDCCGITNPKVVAPTLLIMGEKDYALSFPGIADYIKSDILKHRVPDLETVFVEEGNHFVHEKLPEQVNELMNHFVHEKLQASMSIRRDAMISIHNNKLAFQYCANFRDLMLCS